MDVRAHAPGKVDVLRDGAGEEGALAPRILIHVGNNTPSEEPCVLLRVAPPLLAVRQGALQAHVDAATVAWEDCLREQDVAAQDVSFWWASCVAEPLRPRAHIEAQ
eukprot:9092176-Alexandrium_andersonii.AAC.1